MSPKKPVSKKPAKKSAPKYASQKDVDALASEVAHLKAVLNRRFGFDIDAEPEDIVEAEPS